jgi:outer membrane protein insertion porin family
MRTPVVPNLELPTKRGCWPKVAGALLAALLALGAATEAGAQARQTIDIEGNHRIDAETVRSYFHPTPGGDYDAASLDAALKALIATNLFDHVTIDHGVINRGGEHVIVHLTEAKVLDRVAFEGNKKLKDKDLEAIVESKARGTLQRALVQSDVNRIIEAYRHAGRDDVGVVPETIDRGNERVDLVYEVTEGAKTPVRHINFVGNQAFDKRKLGAVIKTRETNMLSFLTGGDLYDPDRIAADREQLRLFYRSKGYADASVPSADAEYDPTNKGFTLTYTIDEGPVYHVGDVNLVCNVPGVDAEKLRRLLLVKPGALFDGNALDKSNEIVGTELAKLGFPFAQAKARTVRDATARRIDVVLTIDQGPRTYVERIDIHGNVRTRGYVIRREFDIAEGDAYNKTLIDRAERRLKNLNYFKTVKILTKPGSASDRVVLDVEVAEQSTGDISVSGGYSTTDGLLAEVKVGDSNFLGTGNSVKTSFTYGQYAQGADLAASEPYFLGTRTAAGIELFDRQTDASSYQSYGSDVYGATFSLGLPVNEQLGTQLRYSISRQYVTIDPSSLAATPSLAIQQAAAAGPQWVSAVGDTISYNTLDNPRNPTSGISSQLKQDLAGLGGDVNFLRTTEDVRYYQQLTSDLTGMVRAQGGYITGYGGQQVPLIDSFFGGPQLVRGFAPDGFGPRDLTPGSTMDNVGGSTYWATTAELQSAIPGVPQEFGLKGSAFVDAGSVFHYTGSTQSIQLANDNVVRSSVGVGLSWASPFGALTVNYAVPLTKAAYDVVQPLSFNAGPF